MSLDVYYTVEHGRRCTCIWIGRAGVTDRGTYTSLSRLPLSKPALERNNTMSCLSLNASDPTPAAVDRDITPRRLERALRKIVPP